jgi:lipoprotein-anchoring transpeptidase ErfK/SrfK
MRYSKISRREFLQISAVGLGGATLGNLLPARQSEDFPQAERLGRICYGRWDVKAAPDYDAPTVSQVYDDQIVVWLREVVGRWPFRNNQKWIETPDGFLWGAYIQPVQNKPNEPVLDLTDTSVGKGMWVEVTVPYVDLRMVNPPPRHPYFKSLYEKNFPLRFYYSQVLWVDQVRTTDSGNVEYRINELYGNRGDIYWADAHAFRPLTEEEIAPISPDATDKRIVVDITPSRQVLSCFEGNTEVYFCRVSSGKAQGSTPMGTFNIWRKLLSIHMEGGTAVAGWDVGGVGWTNLFTSNGVAIHSTYWHNNFGETESNGCVNIAPQDAKWIFRWTFPPVEKDPGEKTVTDFISTKVSVIMA